MLWECGNALRTLPLRAAWTPPDRMHITLTFNGDLPGDRIDGLIRALNRSLASETAFMVTVKGVGVFGRQTSPRVIWAGIEEGGRHLVRLQEEIAEATAAAGIDLEKRPYHPHITLGRIRHAIAPADRPVLQQRLRDIEDRVFGSQPVNSVTLMRSELTADGVRHSVLQTFQLAARSTAARAK